MALQACLFISDVVALYKLRRQYFLEGACTLSLFCAAKHFVVSIAAPWAITLCLMCSCCAESWFRACSNISIRQYNMK